MPSDPPWSRWQPRLVWRSPLLLAARPPWRRQRYAWDQKERKIYSLYYGSYRLRSLTSHYGDPIIDRRNRHSRVPQRGPYPHPPHSSLQLRVPGVLVPAATGLFTQLLSQCGSGSPPSPQALCCTGIFGSGSSPSRARCLALLCGPRAFTGVPQTHLYGTPASTPSAHSSSSSSVVRAW